MNNFIDNSNQLSIPLHKKKIDETQQQEAQTELQSINRKPDENEEVKNPYEDQAGENENTEDAPSRSLKFWEK